MLHTDLHPLIVFFAQKNSCGLQLVARSFRLRSASVYRIRFQTRTLDIRQRFEHAGHILALMSEIREKLDGVCIGMYVSDREKRFYTFLYKNSVRIRELWTV